MSFLDNLETQHDKLEPLAEASQSSDQSDALSNALRNLDEIQLELDHPTQQVRDILGNPQSEEQCREFLQKFVEKLRHPGE